MTYVVTENCIKCKFMDCVGVCPVNCFHEGENFLTIDPNECIDCGVCEAECPANAIVSDSDPKFEEWKDINAQYAAKWPVISKKGQPLPDAEEWKGKPDKAPLLSPNPGTR
jgi:ferredoxin